ncbi:MAG: Gfo/Idh/MocA family oxidoreductase [Bryobacteraceae bacterium]
MNPIRLAVIGCGSFGKNHLRTAAANPGVKLTHAVDTDPARAAEAAARYNCGAAARWQDLPGHIDAAIVATPTVTHAEIATGLVGAGIDVLVEKPIAATTAEAAAMIDAARANARVLHTGHLERFNPAILALADTVNLPLFFEIHRMNAFAPRSLDVDVVLDLMIHDIDLVLGFTGEAPSEVRAAGVRILSQKVDIANVRLAFPSGCVANLTASRVSTEKIRKLRLFQPHQYISIDYGRQDGVVITVDDKQQIAFRQLATGPDKREPLAAQLDAFLRAVAARDLAPASANGAARALAVCEEILARIEEHGAVVHRTLEARHVADDGPRS